MTRIFLSMLAIAAAAIAQTQTAPSNLAAIPAGGIVAVIDAQGRFAFARLDPSLVLVADNAGALTLRAIAAAPPAPVQERVIVVKPTDPAQATITLPSDPQGESLLVARNGQVLSPGEDYTVAARVITFVAQHRPSPGQVFQVRYRE